MSLLVCCSLVACLPQSTLFNALCEGSQAVAANFPFCTIEPNMGTVAVRHSIEASCAKLIDTGTHARVC